MIKRLAALSLTAMLAAPAAAHDQWADGKPIPSWIKDACCGPAEAHHLRPDQVHRVSDGFYTVEGYHGYRAPGDLLPIPVGKALPSLDGDYWIFYRDRIDDEGNQSSVTCFFVPMAF